MNYDGKHHYELVYDPEGRGPQDVRHCYGNDAAPLFSYIERQGLKGRCKIRRDGERFATLRYSPESRIWVLGREARPEPWVEPTLEQSGAGRVVKAKH